MAYLFYGFLFAIGAYLLMQLYANSSVKNIRRLIGGFALVVIILLLTIVVTAALRGNVGFLATLIFLVPAFVKVARQLRMDERAEAPVNRANGGPMTRTEALEVLGLEEGASDVDIKSAYRDMMRRGHPDHGGSEWMATKLNEAKQVLLGK